MSRYFWYNWKSLKKDCEIAMSILFFIDFIYQFTIVNLLCFHSLWLEGSKIDLNFDKREASIYWSRQFESKIEFQRKLELENDFSFPILQISFAPQQLKWNPITLNEQRSRKFVLEDLKESITKSNGNVKFLCFSLETSPLVIPFRSSATIPQYFKFHFGALMKDY